GDHERYGAQVVGNHAVRYRALPFRFHVGEIGDVRDDRAEQVDLVVVVRALQHRGDALEPHAGIDRRPRQVDTVAAGQLLELHEHQVPDLDEAVALGIGRAGRPAGNLRAVVVENFRARTARTEIAHLPKVVGPRDAHDLAFRQPGDFLPEIEG